MIKQLTLWIGIFALLWCIAITSHAAETAATITGITRDSFGVARSMTIAVKPLDDTLPDNPYLQVPLTITTNSATNGAFSFPLLPGGYQITVGNTRPRIISVATNAVGPFNITELMTNSYVNIFSTNASGFVLWQDGAASNLTVYGDLIATSLVATANVYLGAGSNMVVVTNVPGSVYTVHSTATGTGSGDLTAATQEVARVAGQTTNHVTQATNRLAIALSNIPPNVVAGTGLSSEVDGGELTLSVNSAQIDFTRATQEVARVAGQTTNHVTATSNALAQSISSAAPSPELDPGLLSRPSVGWPLFLPTHDYTQAVTHPNIVYSATNWNGYKYWMVFTPYPTGERERPNIVCSSNGVDWLVPQNHVNPIGPATVFADGYEADAELVMLTNGRLMCIWMDSSPSMGAGGAPTNYIYRSESATGTNWSTPQIVLAAIGTIPGHFDLICPMIVTEPDGTLRMWVQDDTQTRVEVYRSTDLGTNWVFQSNCTNRTSDFVIYHGDVVRVNTNYHMFYTLGGPEQSLRYAVSSNGWNWIPTADVVTYEINDWSGGWYKPTMLCRQEWPLRWDLWVGSWHNSDSNTTPGWRIAYLPDQQIPNAHASISATAINFDSGTVTNRLSMSNDLAFGHTRFVQETNTLAMYQLGTSRELMRVVNGVLEVGKYGGVRAMGNLLINSSKVLYGDTSGSSNTYRLATVGAAVGYVWTCTNDVTGAGYWAEAPGSGGGITAATATNISAYQADLVTNNLTTLPHATNLVNLAASNRVVAIAGANITVSTSSPAAGITAYTIATGAGAGISYQDATNAAIGVVSSNSAAVAWPSSKTRLVFEGDSLTMGIQTWSTNYPRYLTNVFWTNANFTWSTNAAGSGETAAQMMSQYPTQVRPWVGDASTNAIIFLWGGINDIYGGASGPTTWASLSAYYSAVKTNANTTLVAFTVTRATSTDSAYQREAIQYVNQQIRMSTKWDYLIDVDGMVQNVEDTSSTADGVHFGTNVWYKIAAEIATVVPSMRGQLKYQLHKPQMWMTTNGTVVIWGTNRTEFPGYGIQATNLTGDRVKLRQQTLEYVGANSVIADLSIGQTFRLLLTNDTYLAFTNVSDGLSGWIACKQDSTGGRLMTINTNYASTNMWSSITTNANAKSLIRFYTDFDGSSVHVLLDTNFSATAASISDSDVTNGLIAAWSATTIIYTPYSGAAFLVTNVSGGAESNIPFASRSVSLDSLTNFCGANIGKVVKLYDQIGSKNATNGGAELRPTIYSGNNSINEGMFFDVGDWLDAGTDIDTGADGSISAWVMATNINGGSPIFFGIKEGTDANSFFAIGVYDGNGGQAYDGKFRFTLKPTTAATVTAYGNTGCTNNGWFHVVLVNNTSTIKLYVNGVDQSLSYISGNSGVVDWWDDFPSPARWTIGSAYYSSAWLSSWEGFIDDVRVYGRALSASEISTLYSLGR